MRKVRCDKKIRLEEYNPSKTKFLLSNKDKLEATILFRTNAYSMVDIAKRFGVGVVTMKRAVVDNIFTEEEIQNGITSYKYNLLRGLEKNKQKETSLRQEIIKTGLIKLKEIITLNNNIPADKLSGIISQQQKDLWLSTGKPTEISQVNTLSDELLNTLINKIEQNGDIITTRPEGERNQGNEENRIGSGEFKELESGGTEELITNLGGGEDEETERMED